MKKSRLQLDSEVFPLIRNVDKDKIKDLLLRRYRVVTFQRLQNDQLEDFINFLKETPSHEPQTVPAKRC